MIEPKTTQHLRGCPGVVIAVAVLVFLLAVDLARIAVLFAGWPEALESSGFARHPSPIRRVGGTVFFAAISGALATLGLSLLRLRTWSREVASALAIGIGLLLLKRIALDGERALVNVAALVLATGTVIGLALPSVRVAFQSKALRTPPSAA